MRRMAKETVSTRLERPIAEQVDRYAEIHEISRTEALTLFVRTGMENPDAGEGERAYTGVIPEKSLDEKYRDGVTPQNWSVKGYIEFGLGRLEDREADEWENEEEVARSARMPPELVGRMDERAESQDSSRAVVAAEAIERGLKADRIPSDIREAREGRSYTIELDPETAELFRRYRLENRLLPGEVFDRALSWAGMSNPQPIGVYW